MHIELFIISYYHPFFSVCRVYSNITSFILDIGRFVTFYFSSASLARDLSISSVFSKPAFCFIDFSLLFYCFQYHWEYLISASHLASTVTWQACQECLHTTRPLKTPLLLPLGGVEGRLPCGLLWHFQPFGFLPQPGMSSYMYLHD